MTAVAFSLFVAFYVLGPDLIFRWLVSFFAPARVRRRNYGEQIAVACILSALPFVISWKFCKTNFDIYSAAHKLQLTAFFNGLLSQDGFDRHAGDFYKSLPYILHLNVRCIEIVYAIVAILGIAVGLLARYLGRVTRLVPWLAWLLNFIVRPWTAEWHLRLSPMLLPVSTYIQVEVLTLMDVLHRGDLVRHDLSSDGLLVSITLEKPERFRRSEFKRMRKLAKLPEELPLAEDYWSAVPGNFYIIKAEQIATMNVRYVQIAKPPIEKLSAEFLTNFLQDLDIVKSRLSEGPMPFGEPAKGTSTPAKAPAESKRSSAQAKSVARRTIRQKPGL